jgi:hypothetical protein
LLPEKQPLKLIQDVQTRWHSEHDQMKRIVDLKESLMILEEQLPFELFSERDFALMNEVSLQIQVQEKFTHTNGHPKMSTLIFNIVYRYHN